MPASSVPAPRRHRGRVSHSLSVLAVAAVVLAAPACSSDDDKDASPSTTEAGEASSTTEAGSGGSTTAAGGGEGADDLPELTEVEQAFADAIVESFGEGSELFSGADNECLATRWVHVIGEERITEAGITADEFAQDGPGALELDEATGEQMVDAMEQCGTSIDAIYESFAIDPDTSEVDPDVLACMEETAPVAEYRAAMAMSFTGDGDAALAAVGKKWEACS